MTDNDNNNVPGTVCITVNRESAFFSRKLQVKSIFMFVSADFRPPKNDWKNEKESDIALKLPVVLVFVSTISPAINNPVHKHHVVPCCNTSRWLLCLPRVLH